MNVCLLYRLYQAIHRMKTAGVYAAASLSCVFILISPLLGWASTGDLSVAVSALDSKIVLKSSSRFAGAVFSVVFRGKEYIDSRGPGALLQSASSFDNLGECYNPTEAGSWMGDKTPRTSVLKSASVIGNQLRTVTNMGFWRNPDQPYGKKCGLRPDFNRIANTVLTSGHFLEKQITVGLPGYPNVIEHLVTFHVPTPSNYLSGAIYEKDYFKNAVFEASTGYVLKEFSGAIYYDPIHGIEHDPGNHQGDQDLPVILFTPDKRNAMGVYSPQLPQKGLKLGYGRFSYPDVNKWNCVFREHDVKPGSYKYQCMIVLGTLHEVEDTMRRLSRDKIYTRFPSPPPKNSSVAKPIPLETVEGY